MAKSKEVKTPAKAKSESKPLSAVKNGAVVKTSQTPNAKSKKIAKETASKLNGKKAVKPTKAASPSSDSESSASESEEDSEGDSDDSASDSEVEVKKPVAATNGKVNGKTNGKSNGVAHQEVDTSDSSDSSDSSDDDSEASDSDSEKSAAASDSEDSEDSDDSASEDEKPVKATKVVEKAVATGKKAVNGAAKAATKATETSDDDEDSDESSSSKSSGAEEEDDDESDDSESESDSDAVNKKRKADDEDTVAPVKKAKTEVADDGPKNLFVGNLSWNVDDEWLFREFEEFGEITRANVLTDKQTGRSKGFGYVEFTSGSSAAAALEAKKGALIDGREANVDFSTPRSDSAPKDRADGRAKKFGDISNPPSDTLFCGNLSFDADENTIGEAFGAYGTVVNVRLPTDMETGNPKGFGYVTFSSIDDAKAAHEAMKGADIAGRPVRLDFATPKPDRNGGGGGGFGGGRGGGRGGRGGGGFDRRGGGRGGGRGGFGARGGRGGSTNRGGFGDFKGKKMSFD